MSIEFCVYKGVFVLWRQNKRVHSAFATPACDITKRQSFRHVRLGMLVKHIVKLRVANLFDTPFLVYVVQALSILQRLRRVSAGALQFGNWVKVSLTTL